MPDNASPSGQGPSLVEAVALMPSTDPGYGQWWGTPAGLELYAAVTERIGRPLAASLSRLYGVECEAADVANTAFTVLRQEFIPAYLTRSEDPWAYLASVIKREMTAGIGAHFRAVLTEDLFGDAAHFPPAPPVTLHEAADLTAGALMAAAPFMHGPALHTAVLYFAERGHGRLSHLHTDATRDPELADLSRAEILAVANAVLGSRPDHELNSLIAGYLTDPAFNPRSSIRHRRALDKFASRTAKAHKEAGQLVG